MAPTRPKAPPTAAKPLTNQYSTPTSAKWIDAAQYAFNGIYARIEADRIDTWKKRGVFRGGSTGTVLEDGRAVGVCVRAAAARFLGAEPERDVADWAHKQLMFGAGYKNEDCWYEDLIASNYPGVVLREEEFPIAWKLDGVGGTGREDLILCDAARQPLCLLELKNDSSLGTAVEVLLRARPKMDNVIQAANYMLRTGLPGILAYTNRVNISVPDWGYIKPHLPKSISDTEHHAFGYCKWSKGGREGPKVTAILPFIVRYKLRWREGRVEWAAYDSEKWVETPITADGIDAFYAAQQSMLAKRVLAAPKAVVEIDGSKGGYNSCDYCDWNYLCSRVGDDYDRWESHVLDRAAEAAELAAEAEANSVDTELANET